MAKLSSHHSGQFVKLLYLGDSGTGKTGSLVSLVKAGYRLSILDFDNGLDVLTAYVKRECPTLIDNVDYETRRDKFIASAHGPIIQGMAKAFVDALKLMTKWSDDTAPSDWGPQRIFVMDSLTGLGAAAFEWAKSLNPMTKDPRQWYKTAQDVVGNVLALLTSEPFHANVIVIAHVQFQDQKDGTVRGYANTIGQALGPIVPTYFNNMILARTTGSGATVKRTICTAPTALIDLKNSSPFRVDQEYPLGEGLATIFKQLTTKE